VLAILTTHPIQYQAPIWQELNQRGDVPFEVWYMSDHGARPGLDPGFGLSFRWDVDLLDGYAHKVLPMRPRVRELFDLRTALIVSFGERLRRERVTALWINGWQVPAYWQAAVAAHRAGVPVWLRGESNALAARPALRRAGRTLALRALFARVSRFLYIGSDNRDLYLRCRVDPSRLVSAPYGVDNARFAAAAEALHPRRSEIRETWGIPPAASCLLFCGKLIPSKRPLDLLAAVERAVAARPEIAGRVHVVFAGDGALMGALRYRAARLAALAGRPMVSFAGFLNQTEIPRAYAAVDWLVLPSDAAETWGLVVNEALASGIPAIASDLCGSALDLVTPLDPRLVYRCGDVAALARLVGDVAEGHLLAPDAERCRQAVAPFDVPVTVETVRREYAALRGRSASIQMVGRAGSPCPAAPRDEHSSRPAAEVRPHGRTEGRATGPMPLPRRNPEPVRVLVVIGTTVLYGMERAVIETFDAVRPEVEAHFLVSRQGARRASPLFSEVAARGLPHALFSDYWGWPAPGKPRSVKDAASMAAALFLGNLDVLRRARGCNAIYVPNTLFLMYSAAACCLFRALGRPVIFEFHNVLDAGSRLQRVLRGTRWMCSDFVCGSDFAVRSVRRSLPGIAEGKLRLIRRSVPRPSLEPRTRQPLTAGQRSIVFLGQVTRAKGVDIAVDAFGMLHEEFPDARLDVVGGADPAFEPVLRDLVAASGEPGRITLWGYRTDGRELLGGAYALVATSRPEQHEETTGLSVIEAMAAGVPPVVFRSGALDENVTHERTGLVCVDATADCLAKELRRLLADPALRDRLGSAARAHYEARLTPETIAAEWRNFVIEAVSHEP
jgi:glycosyltransferase involved in cell wall biosynthesis